MGAKGKAGGGKSEPARGRLQIYLDDEVRKALRIRAIEEGISASALVLRLIEEYLKAPKRRG